MAIPIVETGPGAKSAAAPDTNSKEPVCLHSLANHKPRQEFLAAETYFGCKPKKIRTQAYLDTLASHCFLSEKIFKELQAFDPQGLSWQYADDTVDFTVALGQEVHTAPVITASFTIDGFQARMNFGIAPLEVFDCILGVAFCHKHLEALD